MKKTTKQWLFAIPGKKNLYILGLLILQSANGALGVFYALLLRNIVDAATHSDVAGFKKYVIEIVLLMAFVQLLRVTIRWLKEFSHSTYENTFKARLFHSLMRKEYLSVSAIHSGEWLNRLTNDCTVVSNGYVEILPGLAEMAVKLLSAVIMIIILEYRFALFLLPFGLGLFLFTTLFRSKMKRLHKNVQAADGNLRILMQERLGSLLMIHSFATEGKVEAEAEDKMADHKAARMKRNHFSNICNLGFGSAMNALYLVGVAWCAYGILTGSISFGTLTAITQLISQIQSPLANVTGYLPKYYSMLASAERLMEAESLPDAFETDPKGPEQVRALYDESLKSFGLKNVDFVYYPPAKSITELSKEQELPAIHDFSLEIQKGEYVAFVGSSGCGKSTALKLLTCTYAPDAGERYFVKTDGQQEILDSGWRRLFAYVPQGNHLMSGTIREVVSFAAEKEVDDGKVREALRIACAEEFVSQLADGLDTILGERGSGLSEGQMQRLAIARAIYSNSPILLLDEATSALDEATERQLLQNLRSVTDRTVVIVTHRPAALEICDRVINFKEPQ